MGGNRSRRAAAIVVVLGVLLTGLPASAQPSAAPFCDPQDGGATGGAADFAFVIDTSGSMSSNDPQRIRVTASQNFVDAFIDGDQGAAVRFSSSASLLQALTADRDLVKQRLTSAGAASGGTNIGAGVQTGLNALAATPDPDRPQYLILLTDGQGSYSNGLTQRAIDEGVVIYAVGLGRGHNAGFLRGVAEPTGGRYVYAEAAQDLITAFADIREETNDDLCPAPTVDAGGPYTVDEGAALTLLATGTVAPDAQPAIHDWDLDGDGTFETPGRTPRLSTVDIDGPTSLVVTARVCDVLGQCATDTATVDVLNVAPQVSAGRDRTVFRDELVALNGRFADPAGSLDDRYATRWTIADRDTGDPIGDPVDADLEHGQTAGHTLSFTTPGTYEARLDVTDADGATGTGGLTVRVLNQPPDCSAAAPSTGELWPPDHRVVDVTLDGVVDGDGDPIDVVVTQIRADEPVEANGDGTGSPDGSGIGTGTASLRAERQGGGNGRVYHVTWTATDHLGGACQVTATVAVPHSRGPRGAAVDDGPLYDATAGTAPAPDAPFSTDDRFHLTEGRTITVPAPGVLGNDTDPDGDALAAALVEDVTVGTLVLQPDGAFEYTPPTDHVGLVTFRYTASDGAHDSPAATVQLHVAPARDGVANTPPTLGSTDAVTDEDVPIVVSSQANDADGDLTTLAVDVTPTHGTAHLEGTGVVYSPDADFHGTDTFTLLATDGEAVSPPATVTVVVAPANDRPTAAPHLATIAEDTSATIDLLNDVIDIDGDSVTATGITQPDDGGDTTIDTDAGTAHYTPVPDGNGIATFAYRIDDGAGGIDHDWVTVTVTEVNDPPLVGPDAAITDEDVPVDLAVADLLGNDLPGPDNESTQALALTAVSVGPDSHGTARLDSDTGLITYTPDTGYEGLATFTATVCDDGTTAGSPDPRCTIGAVEVTVNRVNAPPVAADGSVTTDEDTPVQVVLSGSDPDGDPLAWHILSHPAHGSLTGSGNTRTYTPDPDYAGTDELRFATDDGEDRSAPATVTITVVPTPDAPIATDDQATTDEDTATTIDVLANDRDPDGDPLTIVLLDPPVNGSATHDGARVTYTPAVDFAGADSLRYTVEDPSGLQATARLDITVTPVNDIPTADDVRVTTTTDTAVSVTLTGRDVEGSPLAFAVLDPPSNGNLDGTAPDLTYTPTVGFTGTDSFTYTASDGDAESAPATVTVVVSPADVTPPTAVDDRHTTPVDVELVVDAPGVLGNDDAGTGDALVATAVDQPTGTLQLGSDGSLRYTPPAGFSGTDRFTYTASNSAGSDQAVVTIDVIPDGSGDDAFDHVVVESAATALLPGGQQQLVADGVRADGTATDIADRAQWTSTDPAVATVDDRGLVTATGPGTATITASAGGTSGSIQVDVAAAVPDDDIAPTAAITAPTDGQDIGDIVEVVGTADDANLLRYELALAPVGTADFTVLAESVTPVVDGALGQLDPTLLRNGQYELRLEVTDRGGTTVTTAVGVQVSGDQKVGLFTIQMTDLEVDVAGLDLTVDRVYDSRDRRPGDFGYGWNLAVSSMTVQSNRLQGEEWRVDRVGSGFNVRYVLSPNRPAVVTVTTPSGDVEEFDLTPTPGSQAISKLEQTTAAYTARPGTLGRLRPLGATRLWIPDGQPGDVTLYYDGTLDVYDPDAFEYTAPNGEVYVLSIADGVRSRRDPNGNTLTFDDSGVTHSAGPQLRFTRDADGRITEITDPAGNVHAYDYDDRGDLIAHTSPVGDTTGFAYNRRHGLLAIVAGDGTPTTRNEYGADGRLTAVVDADGNRRTFDFQPGSRQVATTDRNGHVTVTAYDVDGNVTSIVDAMGGTTSFTHDANGNETSVTDANGNTTTRTFDARGNVTSATLPNGDVTTFAYDNRDRLLSTTGPDGTTATFAYDANGNVTRATDRRGAATTFTHDARGNTTRTVGPDGAAWQDGYDATGRGTTTTDPSGSVTTSTYDANGNRTRTTETRTSADGTTATLETAITYDASNRPVAITDAAGGTTTYTYDSHGRQTAVTDPAGHTTSHAYDRRGNLVTITHPDGSTEAFVHDPEGNVVSSTDRAGRTTTHAYDALDRLVSTTYPDGAVETREYDAVGNLLAVRDAAGNTTTMTYDARNRLVSTTDPLGGTTTWVRDGDDHIVAVTDAAGHTTRTDRDGEGNPIRIEHPDGSVETRTYDTAGRLASHTDQAGSTTSWTHDAVGNLATVTDPLGATTTYTHDEAGNLIRQVDALGRTTTWSHDALDRQVGHTLPLGQHTAATYDLAGNLESTTDPNGVTITRTHDAMGQLLAEDSPAGARSFTWTATGLLATATDARGTITFDYDARDRLVQRTDPVAGTIGYAYDVVGNLTSRTTPAGTTSMVHDAAGRLVEVVDPNAGRFALTRSVTGAITEVRYPNGLVTTTSLDPLARPTTVVTDGPAGPVRSRSYTYDPRGLVTEVVDSVLGTSSYHLDPAGRLASETVTPIGGSPQVTAYTWDAVGNRIGVDHGGTVETATFDDNDRLLTMGARTYSWDAAGNMLGESGGGRTALYVYDSRNRIVSASVDGRVVDHEYDALGNRVSTDVDGVHTDLLVDDRGGLSHVLAEMEPGGAVMASTVLADDDVLAQVRGGVPSMFHADHLDSVRDVTDSVGAVTDTYDHDPFGVPRSTTGATVNPYRFAGERVEASGLVDLRNRDYDPWSGRFTTVDPFPPSLTEPATLHRYAYGNGDPVNHVDPNGYMAMTAAIAPTWTMPTLAAISLPSLTTVVGLAVEAAVVACVGSAVLSAFADVDGPAGKCDVTKAHMLFPGRDTPRTTDHIRDAITGNRSWSFLTRGDNAIPRGWYRGDARCQSNDPATAGFWCDEYPFYATREASRASSLRLVPEWEQRRQAGLLTAFFRVCDVKRNHPNRARSGFGVQPVSLPGPSWVCGQ
ncbi:tandem-95 repeat protein [Euzebya rosea]|uniref:tandem-95 repeat protein n=1 Tax=Euzebya rosea TaxID=2052804 RepID=UPI000D3E0C7F|nr:Ig-like domain-containing protein [Euzebya rosea]